MNQLLTYLLTSLTGSETQLNQKALVVRHTEDPNVGRSVVGSDIVDCDARVDALVVLVKRSELNMSFVRIDLDATNVARNPPLLVLRDSESQIPLRYPVDDQLARRSATSSRAGSRAASELDEDLRVHVVCVSQAKFNYAVQIASRSQTCPRAGRQLDSVMEFGLKRSSQITGTIRYDAILLDLQSNRN